MLQKCAKSLSLETLVKGSQKSFHNGATIFEIQARHFLGHDLCMVLGLIKSFFCCCVENRYMLFLCKKQKTNVFFSLKALVLTEARFFSGGPLMVLRKRKSLWKKCTFQNFPLVINQSCTEELFDV